MNLMMKNKLIPLAIVFFVILGFSSTIQAYIVKKGDTLSEIAYKYISPKVYGKNSSINKILALNPTIQNPDFLGVNQIINLGVFEPSNPSRTVSEAAPPLKRGSGSALTLTPFYSILNINSKDNGSGSKSTIASKYYIGVNVSYTQEWTKDFQTAINLKLASINFEKPTSATKTLKDSKKFLSTLGLESNQNLKDNIYLKLNLDYGKELFVRADSTQDVAVDAINIPSVGAKIYYNIKNIEMFSLGIAGSYEAKMPAQTDNYDVKFGHKIGTSIYLSQHRGNASDSNFQVELGLSHRKQDTTVSSQTESSVTLGVNFLLGSGSRP
jgi:hypothetical protein